MDNYVERGERVEFFQKLVVGTIVLVHVYVLL